MSLPSSVIDALVSSGCTAEQIGAAVKAANADRDEREAAKRERDRMRKRREREGNKSTKSMPASVESDGQSVTGCDTPSPLFPPDKEIPPKPPKEINPPISPQPHNRDGSFFDAFWEKYPNKVGKAAARKAWDRAVRVATVEEIGSGLGKYVSKTDDRPWCNPATWLNQERWNDQPAQVQPRASPQSNGNRMSAGDAMRMLKDKGMFNGHDQNTDNRPPNNDIRQLPKPSW